jgi:predicted MFS family arabinose efflux permease
MAAAPPRTGDRVHYAWWVAGAAFLALLVAAGVRSAPSVLLVPLEQDLGWERDVVSFAFAVNLLCFGLVGPFMAALMSRYRVRTVVLVSLALVAGGSFASTGVTSAWELVLLLGVAVGTGTGGVANVLAATVANRWFVSRRGLVTGLLSAATAAGQLAFLPALAAIAERAGWRSVLVVAGIATVAVMPVVWRHLRDDPSEIGLRPYGAAADHVPAPALADPFGAAMRGLTDVVRTRAFWLLAGSFWVCGATTNGLIGTHFIAASLDHGIPETGAATLLAIIGGFNVVGALASGWFTDRYHPALLLSLYYGFRGASLLLLHDLLEANTVSLWVFVIFYGLDWIATVPPTIELANRMFGPERGTIVFGWVFAAHQLGAALAAYGAGVLRTATGSYHTAFVAAGLLCLVACGGVLALREPGSSPSKSIPAA